MLFQIHFCFCGTSASVNCCWQEAQGCMAWPCVQAPDHTSGNSPMQDTTNSARTRVRAQPRSQSPPHRQSRSSQGDRHDKGRERRRSNHARMEGKRRSCSGHGRLGRPSNDRRKPKADAIPESVRMRRPSRQRQEDCWLSDEEQSNSEGALSSMRESAGARSARQHFHVNVGESGRPYTP